MTPERGSLVVGFDGTDESLAAVRLALALARGEGRVHVLRTVDMSGEWGLPGLEGRRERERREMEDALAPLAGDALGSLQVHIIAGDPASELVHLADDIDAEAIVLGSSGKSRLRAALGSVGRSVLVSTRRPVIVVPPSGADAVGDGRPGRVAVALKPATEYEDVVRAACALLRSGGELIVVTADGMEQGASSAVPLEERLGSAESAAARAADFARSLGVDARTVVEHGGASEVLEAAVAEHGIEHVVFGRSSRGKLVEPLLGSTPSTFMREGRVPVSVV